MKTTYKSLWITGCIGIFVGVAFLAWWVVRPADHVAVTYAVEGVTETVILEKVCKVLSGRLNLDVLPTGRGELEVRVPLEMWNKTTSRATLHDLLYPIGRLEFRVAACLNGDEKGFGINEKDFKQYLEFLREKGPQEYHKDRFTWFPVHKNCKLSGNFATAEYHDKQFVLLCSKSSSVKTSFENDWIDIEASSSRDKQGRLTVVIKLNEAVAKEQITKLVSSNKRTRVVLILGDDVIGVLDVDEGPALHKIILINLLNEQKAINLVNSSRFPCFFRIKFPPISIIEKVD
ncbi:MAG: hypothetical protein K8S55_10515 [Phycisphaerae bacterium]|nr:hypothetical protein [Phycisphaerae bacterium]